MVLVIKKCAECGELFATVFERRCEFCQMKDGPKVYELKAKDGEYSFNPNNIIWRTV